MPDEPPEDGGGDEDGEGLGLVDFLGLVDLDGELDFFGFDDGEEELLGDGVGE